MKSVVVETRAWVGFLMGRYAVVTYKRRRRVALGVNIR